MYVDIADMTLEEVSRVCQSLSSARLDAYLTKVGDSAYLYTVDREKYRGEMHPIISEV